MSDPTFEALGLGAQLAQACERAGYAMPSPVQVEAIPVVLRGQDLLALAPTGSGKTAAFVLPLLQRLTQGPQRGFRRVRVLVLEPTRELAVQVAEVFREFGEAVGRPLKVSLLHGGVSVNPQMMALRGGADVVVSTPGRLLDVLARNAVRLDAVEALVLDEADRLLDLGFAAEREAVLAVLPARRQNLLLSATFPPEVQSLADSLLHDPIRIESAAQTLAEPPQITQRAIRVDTGRKTELLRHLLREAGWRRVLVFVATRYATEHVARKLVERGIRAAPLHGELSQSQRLRALADFKAGEIDVLLTTDVAARGIDIPGLQVVVNHDLPRSANDYVHRIGRTGRAGTAGTAVSFVDAASQAHWRLIEKRHGLATPLEELPGFEPMEAPPEMRPVDATGGIKGKRPSKKDKLRAAAAAARQKPE